MRFFRKLRRKLPRKHEIENTPSLSMLKGFWSRSELWAMNRNSLPMGISIGIFCAFLPMPFEMVVAAFLAVAFGGNVIFAISLVWISNPFTWLPSRFSLWVKLLNLSTGAESVQLLYGSLTFHYVRQFTVVVAMHNSCEFHLPFNKAGSILWNNLPEAISPKWRCVVLDLHPITFVPEVHVY